MSMKTGFGRPLLAALALAAGAVSALAPAGASAADAIAGARLAERWCGSCHTTTAAKGADMAPPFTVIANRPGFDPSTLPATLASPHPPMPALGLSRIEMDNIAAYLAGLRTK